MSALPRPLRWTIALAVPLAVSFFMVSAGDGLPFGDDEWGAVMRGLVIGGVTIGMFRFLKLGKWEEQNSDDD